MSLASRPRPRVVWTYEDYRTLPDDRNRYEVIDGELLMTPAPSTTHQRVSKRLGRMLLQELEDTGIAIVYYAPIDVIFSPTSVVQPDLVVVMKERQGIITERGIEGPPDIVIEILSPTSRSADLHSKRKLYSSQEVSEYWIADPETHTVEVLELTQDGYRSRVLCRPGGRIDSGIVRAELPVDEVFRP
jgi:Uma2 family endonuclease